MPESCDGASGLSTVRSDPGARHWDILPPLPKAATIRAVDTLALDHLRADAAMARLINRVGPVKLQPRRLPPFESLVHAVIHQQLNGKAAGTILGRFRALFGNDGFPTPQAVLEVSIDRLRGAGLSRPKTSYVLGLAQQAAAGLLPTLAQCDRMTDEQLLERFTQGQDEAAFAALLRRHGPMVLGVCRRVLKQADIAR